VESIVYKKLGVVAIHTTML